MNIQKKKGEKIDGLTQTRSKMFSIKQELPSVQLVDKAKRKELLPHHALG